MARNLLVARRQNALVFPSSPSDPPHPTPPQVDIALAPGSHDTEAAVNKQLADKERVAAALENPNLLEMVNACTAGIAGGA